MKIEWTRVVSQMIEDFNNISQIKCPNCSKYGIDYIYIGDGSTRIGFLQIWCNKCLKGICISRTIAPLNAKFVTFETDLKGIVPKFEFNRIK